MATKFVKRVIAKKETTQLCSCVVKIESDDVTWENETSVPTPQTVSGRQHGVYSKQELYIPTDTAYGIKRGSTTLLSFPHTLANRYS